MKLSVCDSTQQNKDKMMLGNICYSVEIDVLRCVMGIVQ